MERWLGAVPSSDAPGAGRSEVGGARVRARGSKKGSSRRSRTSQYPQTFASAAFDFLHGLGWEKYPPARYKSTQAFGSGEEVDRAESASFAILALEVLKTQPQFLPSCYNTQESVCKEMLEHLRAMPEAAGALEALRAFEQHAQAEAERQRLAIQRRREQEEEQAELRRQRRNLEIVRCQRARPGRWWVGHCTDNRCTEFDACTYGHEGHDLPPACRWGVHCTTGESCFYNQLHPITGCSPWRRAEPRRTGQHCGGDEGGGAGDGDGDDAGRVD